MSSLIWYIQLNQIKLNQIKLNIATRLVIITIKQGLQTRLVTISLKQGPQYKLTVQLRLHVSFDETNLNRTELEYWSSSILCVDDSTDVYQGGRGQPPPPPSPLVKLLAISE